MSEGEEKTTELGLKIVSIAPTRYLTGRKNGESQRQKVDGLDVDTVGIPMGLDRVPASASIRSLEARSTLQLQLLLPEPDPRPPLIKFTPPIKDLSPDFLHSDPPSGPDLIYRLYHTEAKLIKTVLEQAGFFQTDSHEWNLLWAGTVPPRYLFEGLTDYQRINHFPRTEELTRKDRLFSNITKMQDKFGKEVFNFIPETYILPNDFSEFMHRFQSTPDWLWIAKPHASSQGKGIFIIEDIADAVVSDMHVVSKYIANPLLIDNLKCDLRIYVLVTSYDPLRIYVYQEGLARFASEEYKLTAKNSKFVHLTNYSVNKKNEKFVQNSDYRKDNVGHKWSLTALFQRLRSQGVDTEGVWVKIYDVIIKSVLSITDVVMEAVYETGISRTNCFDLFGFDVLLDSDLKPWVLEVNLSPSLATDSPLDLYIKGHLIADTLNLVGVRGYDRRKESMNRVKARLRVKRSLSGRPGTRPNTAKSPDTSICAGKNKEIAKESVEEYLRRGSFIRIYPNKDSPHYDQYYLLPRPSTSYLHHFLFSPGALPSTLISSSSERRVESADFQVKKPTRPGSVAISTRGRSAISTRKSILFTEEEVMLEYISRLLLVLMKTKSLKTRWRRAIETFLSSDYWEELDQPQEVIWKRVEMRWNQVKRKCEEGGRRYGKEKALQAFSNTNLEDYLRRLTTGKVGEVVKPLLRRHSGILSELTQPRSTTLSTFPIPHTSDEEDDLTSSELRFRALESGISLSNLRLNLKPPIRPYIRKTIRSMRK